ncbi:MAG: isoprenylcysteine carboxylmethyltransferase family protein [Xanthomonadales bacterium]|nr:isoprenylcysteine carboxylmethyltransferase family protein [Xanthomonadales bacterium]
MTDEPQGWRRPRLVPPVYFLASLALMEALHRWWPIAQTWQAPVIHVGWVLLALGLVMILSALGAFSRAATGIVPFSEATAMVTSGFYRVTRNPMYLGMVLILAGIATLRGTLASFLPIPLFAWVIHSRFILREERFMEEAFGAQYLAYKARVRRWL